MFNVWLAGDHLYWKWLFTWLSLVMSLMVSYFVLSFFPRDVLDEIWDRIESIPENFPTYNFHIEPPRRGWGTWGRLRAKETKFALTVHVI